MRTTISLDDQLAKQVRRAAKARGVSVSAFIARTLDDALKRRETLEPPPFRLVTVRGVHPRPGVDLDRPRAFDARDDEGRFGHGDQCFEMLLPDVNVLIYAHVEDAISDHADYAAWITRLATGPEPFALSVLVLSGFIRVVTNPRVFDPPSTLDQSFAFASFSQTSSKQPCQRAMGCCRYELHTTDT